MSKSKVNLLLTLALCLVSTLACNKFSEIAKNATNTATPEPPKASSGSFSLEGKEWKFYDIAGTDIKIELPGEPKDKSPSAAQIPPSYKAIFSEMHISALDDHGFSVAASQLDPTGKRKFTIKELADTSMAAMKKQLPDLQYTLDTPSDTKAKYNGSFTKNGKSYDVGGCCLYKKSDPTRVWAIITIVPKDNPDARTAADRAINNVTFTGGTESCN